ncbi:MAG: ABC transporter ATP-binding protein [Thermoprotei archaeon]|nr:MAG: ABC transporter ATP-binding protein [Thermoprotei archaeon]
MGLIEYIGVWKSYDNTPVIKDVSFKVNAGEIVVLLGPNASGKSTLFKMTLGVVKPDRGTVKVNGIDVSANPIEARRVVGFLPEEIIAYESLKLEEYVEFILSVYGIDPGEKPLNEVFDMLGLREHLGKLLGELSHGNRRKALLATIFLRDPDVLVLDEVFAGLDPAAAKLVKTWLREKAKHRTAVLVSTHVLPIAEATADRVLIIHRGRIVAEGRPGELKDVFGAKELEEVFLEVTGYTREYEDLVRELYK